MQARQIKARLRRRNLTQKELAKRFGVSGATLSMVISGRAKSARLELKLAHALGMSIREFRGESEAA
jgi:transcriptional regulator with XRE-family HTH domain